MPLSFDELYARAKSVLNPRRLSEHAEAGGVGAAILAASGTVYTGVCIDTGCSMGFCAEHAAAAAMVTAGESKVVRLIAVGWDGSIMPPCGRCREFISQLHDENGGAEVMVEKDVIVALRDLLPYDWKNPVVGRSNYLCFWKEVGMRWSHSEIAKFSPILEQIQADLEPLNGKSILVLCSAAGEIPFWLAERMTQGHILGVELNEDLLKAACRSAKEKRLGPLVEFRATEKTRLPLPGDAFDGLVSEFIVFPTPTPTEIGQPEMARVLKPGGRMVITDVIVTKPVTPQVRKELNAIGLDYLCEGTADDFRSWMQEAGLTDIEVKDLTPVVKAVWERRQKQDLVPDHRIGYSLLLEDASVKLGEGIFYIYVRGTKPV